MSTKAKSPIVYLPGLPDLSSNDLPLYSQVHASRMDLVTQLSGRGFYIDKIDSQDSWLKNMMEHASGSDAFVFPPMTSLPEKHPGFQAEAAKRWFEFFSLITGVHVGSREKYLARGVSKPCIVMDPDGQWELAINLLRDLHDKGMFSSKVEDIVQVVKGDPDNKHDYHTLNHQAAHALEEALLQNKGKPQHAAHARYPEDHMFESFRKDVPRHPFGVAIFGSATTQEKSYKDGAFELGKLAGERGWRMVTGAGVDGCMGAADEGFEEGRKTFNQRYPYAPYKPSHIGVSTQAILRLEGPPKNLDQLIITDDIYDRMEVMIKGQKSQDENLRTRDAVRVVFVTPGGTGTLHEFATLMQLATNGSMMKGRTIVLLDTPNHLNPEHGFWEPLIETAKKLGFDSQFKVAKTPEEAIKIADEQYAKWIERHKDDPAHKSQQLPHPVLNPDVRTIPPRTGDWIPGYQ